LLGTCKKMCPNFDTREQLEWRSCTKCIYKYYSCSAKSKITMNIWRRWSSGAWSPPITLFIRDNGTSEISYRESTEVEEKMFWNKCIVVILKPSCTGLLLHSFHA
jgi:hypothetical protein